MRVYTCHPPPPALCHSNSGQENGSVWDSLNTVGGIQGLDSATKPSKHMALLVSGEACLLSERKSGRKPTTHNTACAAGCVKPRCSFTLLLLTGRCDARSGGGRPVPALALLPQGSE